jgi:hypothetical protein
MLSWINETSKVSLRLIEPALGSFAADLQRNRAGIRNETEHLEQSG